MKFTAFHLMSYPYLPDDFTKKYRSVWVDIPRDLYNPRLGHRIYNDYLDQLEFADRMGFEDSLKCPRAWRLDGGAGWIRTLGRLYEI
jgi:hypothetical protein